MEPPRALTRSLPAGVLRVPASAIDLIRGRERLALVGLTAASTVSLIGWIVVLSGLDPLAMDDRGMISILPATAYVALAFSSASFVMALRMRPLPTPLLGAQILAMILMLYGAPGFVEEMPRFVTAWLHVGFADAIDVTGRLHPLRDARFDWPAFFVLTAFVRGAAGFESSVGFLTWVPPVQVALYLAPLYLIYRSATSDLRLIWLAMWIFVLGNWVGQDYFSPQGLNLLFYLVIFGLLLSVFRRAASDGPGRLTRWLDRVRRWVPFRLPREIVVDAPSGSVAVPLSRRSQMGLVSAVALLFGMSVASHQLTPFALLGGVIGLLLFRRLTLPGLAFMLFVLEISWLTFMATTFLTGHLTGLLQEIGRPDQIVGANVGTRLDGSPGHQLVIQVRLLLTLTIWVLAFIGGLRRLASGRLDLSLAILAFAPFGLVLLQSYGGEMLLRIYLFALPFMAFFAASALLPTPRRASWVLSVVLISASIALSGGMLFARYGNEKADMVTPAEYAALQELAAIADPGDLIATVNHNVPNDYFEWEQHRSRTYANEFILSDDPDDLISAVAADTQVGSNAYILISRGQVAFGELFWSTSAVDWETRVDRLAQELEVVIRNEHATVLRLTTGKAKP